MRRSLTSIVFAAALLAPLSAFAQDRTNCPPGSWFCEDVEVEVDPQAAPEPPKKPAKPAKPKRGEQEPAADDGERPRGSTTVVIPPPGRAGAPPVVVYQPVPDAPPAQVIIVAPASPPPRRHVNTKPPPPIPPPPPKAQPRYPEWGLNLHIEGIAMGRRDGAAEDAGMGGLGLGLRFRPIPHFALEGTIDVVGGIDYNGFERVELPLALNAYLYVNPRSKVQFYFLGGLHVSRAEVKSDTYSPLLTHAPADATFEGSQFKQEYSYFGGQGGIGLEFRLSRLVALNVDMLGFVRSRTDKGDLPEYVDWNTGQSTNTSGGGLFRGGLTFWF